MSDYKVLGKNLKLIRNKFGLSIFDIANFLGVSSGDVMLYEGDRSISIIILEKLSDLYGIDCADLFETELDAIIKTKECVMDLSGLHTETLLVIANFRKVVKNYVKMKENYKN